MTTGDGIHGFQKELIELQNDQRMKGKFAQVPLTKFWTELTNEPILGSEPEIALLPFPTTYLCETGFSSMAIIKSKSRNRSGPQHDLRCAMSVNVVPDLTELAASLQHQGSH
jgi:hypothetical protein